MAHCVYKVQDMLQFSYVQYFLFRGFDVVNGSLRLNWYLKRHFMQRHNRFLAPLFVETMGLSRLCNNAK